MTQSVLGSSINTQQNPQSSSAERKIYIDRKTGDIVDPINSAELANYIETTPSTKIYIDITKEFSDGNNAVSIAETGNTVGISVAQYEQYKENSKIFIEKYNNPTTTKEQKHKMITGAMNKIVDSNINFPAPTEDHDIKRLQIALFIMAVGKEALYTPNSPETQKPVDDKQAKLDALMNQLYENTEEKPSNSEASEQNNNSVKGFFEKKLTKKDTGVFWRIRSVGNTTQIINNTEYQGPTMMLSGNGLRLRKARSNVLLNKFISKLEGNDPNVVVEAIMSYRKRGPEIVPRFLHRKKLRDTLKDPIKFGKKYAKQLGKYMENTARNLEPDEKKILIQASNNAYDAFLQQHINQVQSIMTGSDLSSLAGQYNPN